MSSEQKCMMREDYDKTTIDVNADETSSNNVSTGNGTKKAFGSGVCPRCSTQICGISDALSHVISCYKISKPRIVQQNGSTHKAKCDSKVPPACAFCGQAFKSFPDLLCHSADCVRKCLPQLQGLERTFTSKRAEENTASVASSSGINVSRQGIESCPCCEKDLTKLAPSSRIPHIRNCAKAKKKDRLSSNLASKLSSNATQDKLEGKSPNSGLECGSKRSREDCFDAVESSQQIEKILRTARCAHLIALFHAHGITFGRLLRMNEQHLANIGVNEVGARKAVMHALNQHKSKSLQPQGDLKPKKQTRKAGSNKRTSSTAPMKGVAKGTRKESKQGAGLTETKSAPSQAALAEMAKAKLSTLMGKDREETVNRSVSRNLKDSDELADCTSSTVTMDSGNVISLSKQKHAAADINEVSQEFSPCKLDENDSHSLNPNGNPFSLWAAASDTPQFQSPTRTPFLPSQKSLTAFGDSAVGPLTQMAANAVREDDGVGRFPMVFSFLGGVGFGHKFCQLNFENHEVLSIVRAYEEDLSRLVGSMGFLTSLGKPTQATACFDEDCTKSDLSLGPKGQKESE